MVSDPADRWTHLGAFIREQRSTARLSLRRLSELAGISNPYLSQIERGLRKPSAEILQQIAKALRISAETLYVQAGILDPPDGSPDLARQILADSHLSEEQKQALVRIYLSFRREYEIDGPPPAGSAAAPPAAASRSLASATPATTTPATTTLATTSPATPATATPTRTAVGATSTGATSTGATSTASRSTAPRRATSTPAAPHRTGG
jgi:transcriptional regulator with XRE-family HTH domain